MQIKINTQHLHLYPQQEALVLKKVEHLTTLADRLTDESSQVRVDLAHEESRRSEDAYDCRITFFVPQDTLRAEAHGDTLVNALDEVIDKIKTQIEHYKAKIHRVSKRKG
ncbi:MAG: ribosome-associated translation inhibitor RaiA [Candidatus Peregrinibacteria bacterium]